MMDYDPRRVMIFGFEPFDVQVVALDHDSVQCRWPRVAWRQTPLH